MTQAHVSSAEVQHRRVGTGAALRAEPASPTALQARLLTAAFLPPPLYLGFGYGHFWSTRKDILERFLQKQELIDFSKSKNWLEVQPVFQWSSTNIYHKKSEGKRKCLETTQPELSVKCSVIKVVS